MGKLVKYIDATISNTLIQNGIYEVHSERISKAGDKLYTLEGKLHIEWFANQFTDVETKKKQVKCINNKGLSGTPFSFLIIGKLYDVEYEEKLSYLLSGSSIKWSRSYFIDAKENDKTYLKCICK